MLHRLVLKTVLSQIRMRLVFLLLFTLPAFPEVPNPFEIEFPMQSFLSFEDYERVQSLIRKKELKELIDAIYPTKCPYSKNDLYRRVSCFTRQTLISREKNLFPEVMHIRGKEGSQDCIVLGCSFDRTYPEMLRSLVAGLKEIGYEGAIYYRIGGYPNPTGEEVRYAAVPYALKMFMILEAHQLGYNKVLWLDCSAWPLKNLDYCFEAIDKEGILVEWGRPNTELLIPQTRAILEKTFGMDFSTAPHVAGWLLGFKMDLPYVKEIFRDFYSMVRKGTPFLSMTPEETVLTALFARHAPPLKFHPNLMLASKESDTRLVEGRQKGFRFLIRTH
jgi:hypothetical protein